MDTESDENNEYESGLPHSIDKIEQYSNIAPPTIEKFRIVFPFNSKTGSYQSEYYNPSKDSNGQIQNIDIDVVIYQLEKLEDCSEKHMSQLNNNLLLIFIASLLTALWCINCYIICKWQTLKDSKQKKRNDRIKRYLHEHNKNKFAKLGWYWQLGEWGGWLELNRDHKSYLAEEYKKKISQADSDVDMGDIQRPVNALDYINPINLCTSPQGNESFESECSRPSGRNKNDMDTFDYNVEVQLCDDLRRPGDDITREFNCEQSSQSGNYLSPTEFRMGGILDTIIEDRNEKSEQSIGDVDIEFNVV